MPRQDDGSYKQSSPLSDRPDKQTVVPDEHRAPGDLLFTFCPRGLPYSSVAGGLPLVVVFLQHAPDGSLVCIAQSEPCLYSRTPPAVRYRDAWAALSAPIAASSAGFPSGGAAAGAADAASSTSIVSAAGAACTAGAPVAGNDRAAITVGVDVNDDDWRRLTAVHWPSPADSAALAAADEAEAQLRLGKRTASVMQQQSASSAASAGMAGAASSASASAAAGGEPAAQRRRADVARAAVDVLPPQPDEFDYSYLI
jgi:hypothetical protein